MSDIIMFMFGEFVFICHKFLVNFSYRLKKCLILNKVDTKSLKTHGETTS